MYTATYRVCFPPTDSTSACPPVQSMLLKYISKPIWAVFWATLIILCSQGNSAIYGHFTPSGINNPLLTPCLDLHQPHMLCTETGRLPLRIYSLWSDHSLRWTEVMSFGWYNLLQYTFFGCFFFFWVALRWRWSVGQIGVSATAKPNEWLKVVWLKC